MRIGIDIRKYFDFGIGTYIQNLLAEFSKTSKLELTYFATDEQKVIMENSLPGVYIHENSTKYSLSELFYLSKKANKAQIDLLHIPHYTLPFNLRIKSVVTIHDLIHIRLLNFYSFTQRTYASLMIRHACHNSAGIIVVSNFTKNDLLNSFDIPDEKITVVPHGVDPIFFQNISAEEKNKYSRNHNITKPYLLYTGSLKPHKNVPLLIKAFKIIRKSIDVQLVFTGENINTYPEIVSLLNSKELTKNVLSLGHLSRKELVTAYQCAEAVVLPSIYEGFGFSMVEAMASGVPALGANVTSIPEIVGDGGILFDPHDENDLANKFLKLQSDNEMKNELIRKGFNRVNQFSWSKCAQQTLEVYKNIIT